MGRNKVPVSKAPSGGKTPAQAVQPTGAKRPWSGPPDGGFDTCHPLFSLQHLDLDGPFGWGCIADAKLREVIGKLREFEKRTWFESVRDNKKRMHSIETHKLSSDAKKRLEELALDDQTTLLSVGLSGKERVFGIRFETIFFVLWWDPEHGVCPSFLKYT